MSVTHDSSMSVTHDSFMSVTCHSFMSVTYDSFMSVTYDSFMSVTYDSFMSVTYDSCMSVIRHLALARLDLCVLKGRGGGGSNIYVCIYRSCIQIHRQMDRERDVCVRRKN